MCGHQGYPGLEKFYCDRAGCKNHTPTPAVTNEEAPPPTAAEEAGVWAYHYPGNYEGYDCPDEDPPHPDDEFNAEAGPQWAGWD